jgi:hypothetical protein
MHDTPEEQARAYTLAITSLSSDDIDRALTAAFLAGYAAGLERAKQAIRDENAAALEDAGHPPCCDRTFERCLACIHLGIEWGANVDAKEMPASQKIDDEVAQRVMGWILYRSNVDGDWWRTKGDGPTGWRYENWHPSEDIAAAWQVIEKMRSPDLRIDRQGEWACTFGGDYRFVAFAKTAPLAICRAALIAARYPHASPLDESSLP